MLGERIAKLKEKADCVGTLPPAERAKLPRRCGGRAGVGQMVMRSRTGSFAFVCLPPTLYAAFSSTVAWSTWA